MRHTKKILSEIISSDVLLAFYSNGVENLERSRVVEYLRSAFVPILYNNGANVHVSAAQAAFSAGYNKALDDILDFKEEILEMQNGKKKDLRPDYGGFDLAVERKYLTKEEADAIERGVIPRYDPKTGTIKTEPDSTL